MIMKEKSASRALEEVVLATTNVHKVREFKSMLRANSNIDLRSLCDFPNYEPPTETGSTFEENAIAKAVHAAAILNRWVIADDSGLVVPALSGSPGVYSARFAGVNATDADNRKKLLDAMAHLLQEDRAAYYECVIAIASPKGLAKVAKGTCEGLLLNQERGGGGFGYDPLFIKYGYNKTFAELPEAMKNRVSHRRKALDKLIPYLESIFDGSSR